MERFAISLSSTTRKHSQAVEFRVDVAATASVSEILIKALSHTNLYRKEDQDWGLCSECDSPRPLSLITKVNSIPNRKLFLTQILFKISVYIVSSEKEFMFGLSPLMTVSEAVLFIEQSNYTPANFDILSQHLIKQTPSHELLLVTTSDQTSTTARGIPLDFHRTLRSYRISPADTLILTAARSHNRVWTDIADTEGEKQIPVIVSSEEFGCSKAFKINLSSTFRDVLTMFLEKTNEVILHSFYTLYLDMGGTIGEQMNLEDELSSYPLPTPARLKCIAKPRPAQVVFGVDPATLPLVNDMGVDVPEILVILRDMLILLDPWEQEGIFRKAGNETEMKKMIKNLNEGKPIHSTNIHSLATLLKRWFKDLPKRIFSHIHKSVLDDPERLLNIYDDLSPMESSLAKWLLELLVDISKHSEINKMSPSNLGIVFGPGVYGSSGSFDPTSRMAAIAMLTSDSKTGQEIIEKLVDHLLQHPEDRPLKPEKPLINTVITNSYKKTSDTTPNGAASMQMARQPILLDFSGDSKMAQMLARRRQMVEEGVTSEEPITVTKHKTPSPVPRPAPVTPQRISETVSGAIHRNTTGRLGSAPDPCNIGGGRGGRIKSMMVPSVGVNMQSELKNRIAGGRGGLRKVEAPRTENTGASESKNDFRASIALQKGKSASSNVFRRFITEPKPGNDDSSISNSDSSVKPPNQPAISHSNSPPSRVPPPRSNMHRGRGRGSPNRSRGAGPARNLTSNAPNVSLKLNQPPPPTKNETEEEIPISPRKLTPVVGNPPPSVVKYPVVAPPPRPQRNSEQSGPVPVPRARPVSTHARTRPLRSTNEQTNQSNKPNFKLTPLRGEAQSITENSLRKTMPGRPLQEMTPQPTETSSRRPVPERNISTPKLRIIHDDKPSGPLPPTETSKAETTRRPVPERNISAPRLRIIHDDKPTGPPPIPPKSLQSINNGTLKQNNESAAHPLTVAPKPPTKPPACTIPTLQALSPRSRLDLLIEAADDYECSEQGKEEAEEPEDDLLMMLGDHEPPVTKPLPIPPSKSKQAPAIPTKPNSGRFSSAAQDEDSDPIEELLAFVESESTPLEKLLGLEAPPSRASVILPPEPIPKPVISPRIPPKPMQTSLSGPIDSGPPDRLPPRILSTPAARAQTDSHSPTSSRRSILFRKKKDKKEKQDDHKKEDLVKRKSKRFSRFGKKEKEVKSTQPSATGAGALDQPGITWGKSKDAQAILDKLRSEGLV